MESPHRLSSVGIDFDWSIIYFRYSLQFNIITPDGILALVLHIQVKVIKTAHYKLTEKVSLQGNVVHAGLSDQIVVRLVSVVYLIRNGSEQAIPISFHFFNLHVFHGH